MKGWTVMVQRAVVVCLLSAAAGCRSPSGPSDAVRTLPHERAAKAEALALFSRGISAEWERDGQRAFSNYARAAALDPDHAELQFCVALGLLQDRRPQDAVAIMERLARRHADSERVQLWYAFVCRAADNPEKAIGAYQRALKINPASTPAYLEQAALYARMERVDKAVAVLERAVPRAEDPVEILQVLGDLYIRQAAVEAARGGITPRLRRALARFEDAVRHQDDHPGLLTQLGDLFILRGDLESAIRIFERVEELQPGDLRLRQRLARNLLVRGQGPDARATLERMLTDEPGNARLLFFLGQVHEQMENLAEARACYEKAMTADPADPAAYLRLAMLQVAAEEADAAVATLRQGLERRPDDERYLELLAYIHLGRREYPEALEFFARTQAALDAAQSQPITPNFHLNHAIATQLAGHTADAASLLYRAMSRNRAYLDAYMSYVFQASGETNLNASVRVLDKVSEKAPEDANLFVYIGLLNNYAKRYAPAIEAFAKAERLAREHNLEEDVLTPSFYFWYGAASERNGDFDRAVALFQQCIALEPPPGDRQEHKAYVDALNYLAYMWAERGLELEQALRYVKRALEVSPDSAAYLDTLGWIYFMQQRYSDALREITRALALLPDDPTITDHLGDVHAKLGNLEEAIVWWRKSFVLDPDNEKVAAKLREHAVDLAPLREEASRLADEDPPAEPGATDLPTIELESGTDEETPADDHPTSDEEAPLP